MNLNLLKRRDTLVVIVVICIGIVVSVNLYKGQMNKIATLEANIKEEKDKNELLVVLNKLEEKLNVYKERLQKKDVSFLVNKIAELSRENQIAVSSFNPGSAQEAGIFVKTPLTISLEANYHQLGNLVSKIENLPYFLRVDNLSITAAGPEIGNIERINLVVSSIYLKDSRIRRDEEKSPY